MSEPRKSQIGDPTGQGEGGNWGHLTVQAHFMPHDAKTLDPARSMNVLVGTAGSSSLLHFCCCPGTPGEPHLAMLRQPKQGKDHFQGQQSGLPTLWTDGGVCGGGGPV